MDGGGGGDRSPSPAAYLPDELVLEIVAGCRPGPSAASSPSPGPGAASSKIGIGMICSIHYQPQICNFAAYAKSTRNVVEA